MALRLICLSYNNGQFNKPLVFGTKKETEEYWDKLFLWQIGEWHISAILASYSKNL